MHHILMSNYVSESKNYYKLRTYTLCKCQIRHLHSMDHVEVVKSSIEIWGSLMSL